MRFYPLFLTVSTALTLGCGGERRVVREEPTQRREVEVPAAQQDPRVQLQQQIEQTVYIYESARTYFNEKF